MTYHWIKFFQTLSLLSIVGTLIIIAFEIKDYPERYRSRRTTGGRTTRSLASIQKRSLRWSAMCILWTVVGVCQMAVLDNAAERLFWVKLTLWFLAMALIFMQMPRIGGYIRRKRVPPDPQSALDLSQ